MALIVMFLSLFSFSLVYHAVALNNKSDAIKVKMKCRCGADGFKTVHIMWLPLPQDQDASYRVYFSTDTSNLQHKTEQYQFGCTVNTTHPSLPGNELQCSITSQTVFPFNFYFKLEMTNSSGVYFSSRKTCRLASSVRCTKPQHFKVIGSGRRNLSLSWEPAPYMGPQTRFLCYRILYASAQGKTNESLQTIGEGESTLVYTLSDLDPYTKYSFFIQCSLFDCLNGWGVFSGPVIGMTKEQAPAKAPEFENWSVSNIENDKRDVTVMWKLPPSNTWNGVPKKFAINFWQVSSIGNNSLTPIPNSSRSLQIKNGSVNRATLPGLNRFADYQSQIRMCNTGGCGPRSTPWLFKGDTEQDINLGKAQSANADASFPWIVVVGTIAGLVLVFIIVVFAVTRWKNSKERERRRQREPLDERLDLSTPPLYEEIDESTTSTNNYSQIQHEGKADDLISSDLQPNNGNGDLHLL